MSPHRMGNKKKRPETGRPDHTNHRSGRASAGLHFSPSAFRFATWARLRVAFLAIKIYKKFTMEIRAATYSGLRLLHYML